MMRRSVDATPAGSACRIGGLLLVLVMVLGMLVHDITRERRTANAAPAAGDEPTRLLLAP
jgi:hypothetical protein